MKLNHNKKSVKISLNLFALYAVPVSYTHLDVYKRQDVDDAIQQSLTWRQFLSVLERKGYEVRMGRKYPVLRPPGKERFVRFKTLGKRLSLIHI